MREEAPSLLSLCIDATQKEIICGTDLPLDIYELPTDLLDSLPRGLPPIALQKLEDQMPFGTWDEYESTIDCTRNKRRRKRYLNLDTEWRKLYLSRWPGLGRQNQAVNWLANRGVEKCNLRNDWQEMYWEAHLQNCLDEVAEVALLPSFDGCIGEVRIPDAMLELIGDEEHKSCSSCNHAKFSYHCQQFGFYARYLRLQNVLCVPEMCLMGVSARSPPQKIKLLENENNNLLKTSKLQHLELRWIKSKKNVEGVCKLLNQNRETLTSLEFVHCKLSSTSLNAICETLFMEGLQTHIIKYFSIKASSFLEMDRFKLPVGLSSFLSSGRSFTSLVLCENHFGPNIAKMVFKTLLDAASGISVLDLSENNIAGWLSDFGWRSSSCSQLSSGMENSLQLLRVLHLRGNNLRKSDAESLKSVLVHTPKLEMLDISDNPLEDDGIKSLLPYFVEMSERHSHFADLSVENCDLTCAGLNRLIDVLLTMNRPLNSLSIAGNELGSKFGATLGKILCAGIQALNIEDIGLGPSGFLELQDEIKHDLKIVYINMSKNRGGVGAAKFLETLIPRAPELVAVNAGYNFMPSESLSAICYALEVARGKLEHIDLTGNNWRDQPVDASMLSKFQINGKAIFVFSSSPFPYAPYDCDPSDSLLHCILKGCLGSSPVSDLLGKITEKFRSGSRGDGSLFTPMLSGTFWYVERIRVHNRVVSVAYGSWTGIEALNHSCIDEKSPVDKPSTP